MERADDRSTGAARLDRQPRPPHARAGRRRDHRDPGAGRRHRRHHVLRRVPRPGHLPHRCAGGHRRAADRRGRPRSRCSTRPPRGWPACATTCPGGWARIQGRSPGRRRADDHQRRHRLHGAAWPRATWTPATWSWSRRRPTSARSWRSAATRRTCAACRWTTTGCGSTCWRTCWPAGCGRRSSTPSPTSRTRPACRCRAERRQALVALARRYGFLILEDVAYRELRLRRRGAAQPVVGGAGRGAPGRHVLQDLLPRASGSAGPPARPRSSARLVVAKQNSDQCSGALGQRLLEEYGRGGAPGRADRAVPGAVRAPGRARRGGAGRAHARGHDLDHAARRLLSPG